MFNVPESVYGISKCKMKSDSFLYLLQIPDADDTPLRQRFIKEEKMKIAFWSEEEQTETAFNMALVACASALMYPLCVAVVSGSYNGEKLEQNFLCRGNLFSPHFSEQEHGSLQADFLTDENRENCFLTGGQREAGFSTGDREEDLLAAEQQEYFLAGGLDYLLSKSEEELTIPVIRENMHQIIKDRMYCLPGSRRREQEWWYKDPLFTGLKRVMYAVEHCFDVVFVDCGSRKDDVAQNLLSEADICVLNMDQDSELIGDYYRNPPKFRGKTFFLVGNYFENGLYTRKNLERIYRVEEHMLGAILYHPQMQAAGRTGRAGSELGKHLGEEIKGKSVAFERELTRTTRLILKMAGVII